MIDQNLNAALYDPPRVKAELAKWRADPDAYLTENLSRLAEYDFPVYAEGNIRIQDKIGRSIPFRFNRLQRRLWKWFIEDLASGKSIRWYIVKARQLGSSTWVIALFYYLASLRANRNILIVAQEEDAVLNFNSRIRSMWTNSHPLLKPKTVADNRDVIHFGNKTNERKVGGDMGLDSKILFMTAGKGELGRAFNFHAVLLSEFAIWPQLGIDIYEKLGALSATIADYPGTIVIIETTAKGQNAAHDFWTDGDNGYRKIFIPWIVEDSYRLPLEEGELLELCSSEELAGQQTKYGDEVRESSLIERHLKDWYPEMLSQEGWLGAEIRSRLKWRRHAIDTITVGDKTKFRQEFPTTESHAFSASGKDCFDHPSLDMMEAAVKEEAIEPRKFVYRHDPENEDQDSKFEENPYGSLIVYRPPEKDQMYVIGGDCAQGIPNSGDPSSLVVLTAPDLEEVASFNQILTPDRYAELAFYLALLYNNALLGIESNDKGGFTANVILSKQLRYRRLYYHKDPFEKETKKKPGYFTTDIRKSHMVAELGQLILDHQILIRNPELARQLKAYQQLKDGSLGAPQGSHDDLVSALMIAVQLASRVHLYPLPPEPVPKGSFLWHAQRHARRNQPSLLGYK